MSTDDADTNKDAETTKKTADESAATDAAGASDAATAKLDLGKAGEKQTKSEPKPKPTPAASQDRSNLLPVIAAFVAGILLVAAVTAVVVFYLQAQKKSDELAAVNDATRAACDFGRDVSVYDYSKDLEGYFTKVKEGSTGEFLKEFTDATTALTDAMVQAQVKSWADDVQCGYQSGDTTEAKVLVTLTQFRTNFTQQQPDRQFVVIVADLQNEDGKWKVAKLDSPMLKGGGTGLPGGAPAPAPAPTEQPQPQPGN
ncbi:hypothetical protein ACFYT3_28535 [Nocardia amikacinitolerans]|uniref:hypothetical protein n=1 Tax=Nocardia amikacinitolerans TaxID=756689 RepID=UPI0020A3493B|nr:hypothetical protein [Nocardia amikacinitolerans]MCP2291424.1 Mce-associated membrane protein [Nocardia amikacinitolerans]